MATERFSAPPEPILSRQICVGDATEPIEGAIETTKAEQTSLAPFLGVESLDSVSLQYRLSPASQGRCLLTGKLEARLAQQCVVTLESLTQHLEEEISLECWPADQIEDRDDDDAELAPDVLPKDPPVPIVDGRIDLGMLAVELLASAIDPYPRKEGVEFDWDDPKHADADKPLSPFAALAKLKQKS